jgi:hypothetical protein
MSEEISSRMSPPPKSLLGVRRRVISVASKALVRFGSLPTGDLPLLVEPASPGGDLAAWASSNRQLLEEELHKHGGILFRGFNLSEPEHLETFIQAVAGESLEYRERSSPRHAVKGNIYTSTDYPASHPIFLHTRTPTNRSGH